MKYYRTLAMAAVLAASAAAVFAQDSLHVKVPGRIEFRPHWFLTAQGGASYTLGEADFGDLISPAASLSAGYQFTPLWGIRTGISGWEAKGALVAPEKVYGFNYLQGNIDTMLDLGNLFCGYSPKRFFNSYLFLGIGVNGGFGNGDAEALANAGRPLEYLWNGSKVNVAGRGGIGTNLRLCDNVFFNLEINANILSDTYNSKKAGNPDWQFNALAGITFKFGDTHKKIEPVYEEPEELPLPTKTEPVREAQPQPVPAKEDIAKKDTAEPVKKQILTENVFFRINSAVVRNSEKPKIEKIVRYLKEHADARVRICGYADRQTGTHAVNMRISRNRAESVAKMLEAAGVAADRIAVGYKGDSVQPFATAKENRVCICIAE